jgi:hypothetical protein
MVGLRLTLLSLLLCSQLLWSTAEPCDYFKQFIGKVPTCQITQEDLAMDVNPGPTPVGGIDVSKNGCQYISSQKCCGIYPRWNWVLGSCDNAMPPSSSHDFACTADVQNSSVANIYYIAGYQWSTSKNAWVLDPTSSVFGDKKGGLANQQKAFQDLKIDGTNSPNPRGGDWQAKWAPRTASTQTQGLGPPAFMFVISSQRLNWMTFYSLPQKTINRGPENQFSPPGYDNCWYAELDFLEAPFWADASGHRSCYLPKYPSASFFSTGAQFGGCFPMGDTMGNDFSSECLTEWCCEGTACPKGYKGFINTDQYGQYPAGCVPEGTPNPPAGTTFVGPKTDPTECGNFAALGGCDSNSFMENDPLTEYTFAFVVDKKGIWVYRWFTESFPLWPGIKKYDTAEVLLNHRPTVRPFKTTAPCLKTDRYCMLFHPTSSGQQPCVFAAGNIHLLNSVGVATADGKNWWDLFSDTGQGWDYNSTVLPTKI